MPEDPIDEGPEGGAGNDDGLKDLRAKARKADKLETELAEYRKKDAFRDAKVDLNSPVGKHLFETWTGDATVEAIAAKAEELGCLEQPGTGATTEPPEGGGGNAGTASEDERRATAERQALATGQW